VCLVSFAERLQLMAYGKVVPDEVTPEVLEADEIERCFQPVRSGLDETWPFAKRINADEKAEVAARRDRARITKNPADDAVGLALSGGGIRSATFCLGVVQVLADRGLMKDFDFLSTVSGGGYTGSFITSRVGRGAGYELIASPFGPDTDPIKHLRQNAKYLSPIDLKHRWLMVTGTMAGLIMNWMAPMFVLAAAAWASNHMAERLQTDAWLAASGVLILATAVAIVIYGFALRVGASAGAGSVLLACVAGAALLCASIFVVEWGYLKFKEILSAHWQITGTAAMSVIAGPAVARFLPVFRTLKFRKLLLKASLYAAGILVPLIAVVSF